MPDGDLGGVRRAPVHPDLSGIHFIARAITPPRRARRFDTRFFTADAAAIAHRIEGVVGPEAELVELVWLPLDEAKRLDLLAITEMVLEDSQAQIAAGFEPRSAGAVLPDAARQRVVREMLYRLSLKAVRC